ncbi:MAG: hypothetical protein AB7I27_09580 [Bacteriovoracaceae bacterium]
MGRIDFVLTLLFFLLFASKAFSQGIVTSIHNDHEILASLILKDGFSEKKRVIVISKTENKLIAFGQVRKVIAGTPTIIKVRIEEVIDNSLIKEGDQVELLSVETIEARKIPGFTSLTLSGNGKIPAQYKELTYLGVFNAEGHNLDKGEALVSPFQIQYGISDKVGVKVVNALFLDGYMNGGVKYGVMRNKYAKATVNAFGAYKVQSQDWIAQFGGILSMPSNAKFQSHLAANIILDPQFKNAHATRGLGLYDYSDIRSITEYVTDSWNRVLFGPVYSVELQTLGGTASYVWIWSTFHMNLGIATKDFSNLTFGSKGYYYVYDFFWRF